MITPKFACFVLFRIFNLLCVLEKQHVFEGSKYKSDCCKNGSLLIILPPDQSPDHCGIVRFCDKELVRLAVKMRGPWSPPLPKCVIFIFYYLLHQIPQSQGLVPRCGKSKLAIRGQNDIADKVAVTDQGLIGNAVVGLITGQLPQKQILV